MDQDKIQEIFDRANDLLESGAPEEALRCLKPLEGELEEAEDRIEFTSLQAWALSEIGRHQEAMQLLEEGLAENPESGRLQGSIGVVLSNAGDLDGALAALERAVEMDENDEVSLANLGLIYERLHQYEQALQIYNRAVEMGAEIDWLLKRLAAVQAELGQADEARRTLMRYLSLAPDDADQWVTLGILYSDENQFEDAFRCFRMAEQAAPDSASLRLNWGVTGVRAHRLEVAEQQLRYLKRLEPESTRPLLLKAFIVEERGDLKAAHRHYLQALNRMHPDDYEELTYTLEMAMDFFSRHGFRQACEQILQEAYQRNACTVELCEAFREATGQASERANWYSLILEGDYRKGLEEVVEPAEEGNKRRPFTRFLRNYQVIAKDHDDAVACALQLAQRMGESNVRIREFVSEESISNAYLGVYEIERESLVFAGNGKRRG